LEAGGRQLKRHRWAHIKRGVMDITAYILPIFFFIVITAFLYQIIKYRGIKGALLRGRITQTIGEIELSSPALTSRLLKIHILESSDYKIGIEITSKAPFGISMIPISMTIEQAIELNRLLSHAINEK
jgi:hypothetical protein